MSRQWSSYIALIDHGSEITVEVGWYELAAGQVPWDRWTAETDDPVMAFASIGFLFETREYRRESKPVEATEPPLYRYHPERFRACREYAGSLASFYQAHVEPETGMLTLDQLNDVTRPLMEKMNRKGMTFPRKLKDDYPQPTLVTEAENSLAMAYGRFVQAGRQIMDFPPELTGMLAKTSVDDVPLNNIHLPYASQYLCFGPQEELELEPGWRIDGPTSSPEARPAISASPSPRSLAITACHACGICCPRCNIARISWATSVPAHGPGDRNRHGPVR